LEGRLEFSSAHAKIERVAAAKPQPVINPNVYKPMSQIPNLTATALAHPNIAFIKYWGNTDNDLRLPANPSLSMNLGDLHTITTVTFADDLSGDELIVNQQRIIGPGVERVTTVLDLIRLQAGLALPARVESANNFPAGAGIASSASAFAALSLAGAAAAGLDLDEASLSRLARRGSGSASRSVPGGFCQWFPGSDEQSVATSIAPPEHWDLRDIIVVVSQEHKAVGSTGGHRLASTSSLQAVRIAGVEARFEAGRAALLARNMAELGPILEEDAIIMHAVMMTSHPPLYYWDATTMALIQAVLQWRAEGIPVYFTIDAGPNVHFICEAEHAESVRLKASQLPGIQQIIISPPGGPARLL
jgi:diphosphomevalonate decarboxylase